MMEDPLGVVTWMNLWLTAFTTLMAAVAGWINWWTWRRQLKADEPGLTYECRWTEHNGIAMMQIEVNNRSDVRWQAIDVQVSSPRSARALSQMDTPSVQDGAGSSEHHPESADQLSLGRRAPLHLKLAPLGRRGNSMTYGDTDRAWEVIRTVSNQRRRPQDSACGRSARLRSQDKSHIC